MRCPWAKGELDIIYHDTEWGIPVTEDAKLFEMLILEGMQAGLSWSTILKRRDSMRKAFDGFDYKKIAEYSDKKIEELLQNEGVIRHRGKLTALSSNAVAFMKLQKEHGTFAKFIWQFVKFKPIQNSFKNIAEIPAKTIEATEMSKALVKNGFKFVGPTICYAFMQATGMVNDHLTDCPEYNKCKEAAGQAKFK